MTHASLPVHTTTVQVENVSQGSPFSSLRLSQNFGESLGVKKVLTTEPVGKPSKDRFFRTHTSPSWVFPTWILEKKSADWVNLVSAPTISQAGFGSGRIP